MADEEFTCRAISDYCTSVTDELELKEGQQYTIMQTSPSGWWYAVNADSEDGWVPSNYLERIDAGNSGSQNNCIQPPQHSYIKKYNSVEMDINDICFNHFPSRLLRQLSSNSKLVYNQWTIDKKDDLLIHGYFRECNITTQPLSIDVNRIIASYYIKNKSKGFLQRKISDLQKESISRRKKQIKTCKQCIFWFLIFLILVAFAFSTDVVALITVKKYDCDMGLTLPNSIIFGINDFLYIGSIVHITVVVFLLCIMVLYYFFADSIYWSHDRYFITILTLVVFVSMFFISWSAVGIKLYQNTYHQQSHIEQCSNVLISWIIFKFVTYGLMICTITYFITHEYKECIVVIFGILIIGIYFATDVALLVINETNDCKQMIENSKFVSFTLNEFILIGCVIHLMCTIFVCLFQIISLMTADILFDDFVDPNFCCYIYCCLVVSFYLFMISWIIVGWILLGEISRENKFRDMQCWNVLLAWNVTKTIETLITPFFSVCLLFYLSVDAHA